MTVIITWKSIFLPTLIGRNDKSLLNFLTFFPLLFDLFPSLPTDKDFLIANALFTPKTWPYFAIQKWNLTSIFLSSYREIKKYEMWKAEIRSYVKVWQYLILNDCVRKWKHSKLTLEIHLVRSWFYRDSLSHRQHILTIP